MNRVFRDLILAGDPVPTTEFPPTLGLMPLYVCWDPDPKTFDLPVLADLLERGPAKGAEGIDRTVAWLREPANKALADNCHALRIVEDGRDYVYLHYGAKISGSVGRDNTGSRLSTMAEQSASARLYGPGYEAVALRPKPLYSENANTAGLLVNTWRRLVVPTIGRDGKTDGFVVANVAVHGLPTWPLVVPRPGTGAPPRERFQTARDRFSGLSSANLTAQIEGTAQGLFGVGQVAVAILSHDLSIFRFVGAQLGKMLGMDALAITRRQPKDILIDATVFDDVIKALDAKTAHCEVETDLRRADGSRLFARLTFGRMDYNMSPAIALWISDLTEHKHLQEDLLAAQGRAEREYRARQRLWASLAHDIRTPVNAVIGFAQALEHLPKVDEARAREYGGLIGRAGAMLSTLIDDLLFLSRLDAGMYPLAKADIDPAKPIEAAIEIAAPLAKAKAVMLKTEIAEGLRLDADADALSRIALNLLTNAVKFTPKGGRISLGLARAAEGGVRLVVADTGRGISPEALARILDPFEQADAESDRKTGTGLGLSIVKALVDLHGGTLDIRSAPGQGTTVTIDFP